MDVFWTCLCYAVILHNCIKLFSEAERLSLDTNLTRKEIITILGRKVNLGCYVTKNYPESSQTQASSLVSYVWLKENTIKARINNSSARGHVLVVDPKDDSDFGTYWCNVTNGVSRTQCSIKLKQGWTKTEIVPLTTGCVNISLLMPVLAVAVLSLLLVIHLLIKKKNTKKALPETSEQEYERHKKTSVAHPHAEQRMETRRLSRDLLYNSVRDGSNNKESKQEVVSVEMHVGGELHSTPNGRLGSVSNLKRERQRGFYNKSVRNVPIVSGEGETTPKGIGFYNANFKNESMDSGLENSRTVSPNTSFDETSLADESTLKGYFNKTFKNNTMEEDGADDVFTKKSEELTAADKSKSGKAMGFYNKTFHSDSMDLTDDANDGTLVSVASSSAVGEAGDKTAQPKALTDIFPKQEEEMTVADKSKSGKAMGFFNKTFHSDSIDVSDGDEDGFPAAESGNPADSKTKDEKVDTSISNDVPDILTVAEKSKSGKAMGFFNKTFHESVDIPDDVADGAGVSESGNSAKSESKEEETHASEEDTYF
ncbi:uncharacterized protein LOC111325678 isoform X2 [Stylophora pistillata]|uniref:uncharacterized protein LOC111325678 isoform X2 n=1 Tax=Stylophora pistillata TaxID=50429 RepID=UPI000C053EA6|nr:uncharacterized protein LOC111325678 isoform X2 [Stylophora pistillata]